MELQRYTQMRAQGLGLASSHAPLTVSKKKKTEAEIPVFDSSRAGPTLVANKGLTNG